MVIEGQKKQSVFVKRSSVCVAHILPLKLGTELRCRYRIVWSASLLGTQFYTAYLFHICLVHSYQVVPGRNVFFSVLLDTDRNTNSGVQYFIDSNLTLASIEVL